MSEEAKEVHKEVSQNPEEEAVSAEMVETGEKEEVEAVAEARPVEEESELNRLRQELEEARAQAAEYLDGWQRSQAEFANYRKRQEAEWQRRTQMSNAHLIGKLLPVLDDLERAMQTLPLGLERLTWIEGVFLIKRKLEVVLESEGVRPIEAEGQTFDPLYHEAVTYEEVEGYEDGKVIGEVQRGYMLGDQVIRPALVRVARAPIEPAATKEGAGGDAEMWGRGDAGTRRHGDTGTSAPGL